jgi:2-methylisocitrate lyase-like PEP mutase family enzyme
VIGLCEDALPHSVSVFTEAGYLMVLGPTLLLFASIRGMSLALDAFRSTLDWNATKEYRVTADEFYELIGWSRYQDVLERQAESATTSS